MNAKWKVPFDENGNQLDYDAPWIYDKTYMPNFEFDDTLTYETYSRGRSAVGFTFRRKSADTLVNVFMTDMDKMIPMMQNGQITGKFTFCKRGANFGCKMVVDTI